MLQEFSSSENMQNPYEVNFQSILRSQTLLYSRITTKQKFQDEKTLVAKQGSNQFQVIYSIIRDCIICYRDLIIH
jgi:hypothetical protein